MCVCVCKQCDDQQGGPESAVALAGDMLNIRSQFKIENVFTLIYYLNINPQQQLNHRASL